MKTQDCCGITCIKLLYAFVNLYTKWRGFMKILRYLRLERCCERRRICFHKVYPKKPVEQRFTVGVLSLVGFIRVHQDDQLA